MQELIVGVDEAGRGPLAGPVVAAAVVLDQHKPITGLQDSKKLTAKQRDKLFENIRSQALAWSIAQAEVEEIDEINILQATMLAMKRAVESLAAQEHVSGIKQVLIDGNRCPDVPYPAIAIIKGDSKEPAISAASILAKVTRDRQMQELHQRYPEYEFDKHKGYPTVRHRELLVLHGPSPVHRRSFRPVAEACLAL